ncbi:MAG TPA: hypothetical protein VN719_00065, partial [Gemmatimonadales bacterium]|nr:hypothetical protein [Gemmatimonadales bacterium]
MAARHESAVNLEHHRCIAVSELPRDQFERHAGADHADRPMVAGVVEPMVGQPEYPQALAMHVKSGVGGDAA